MPLVLTSPRLILRPGTTADHGAVLEAFTDAEVMRYLGGPRDSELIAAVPARPAEWSFAVADAATDARLGEVSLTRRATSRPGHLTTDSEELELSYVFRRDAWGQGYAAEACRRLLSHAAQLADKDEPVLIATQSANERSLRLAARLGFATVSTFREFGAEQTLAWAPLGLFAPS